MLPTDHALRLRTQPFGPGEDQKLSNKSSSLPAELPASDLKPSRLQSAASQLGDSVTVLRGDVSKPAEVESIIKQISEKFGRIDVLFANPV
jgi:NAD(P)-dependent dehydrogenase (short-subunit alcohol dehydrogenase family)